MTEPDKLSIRYDRQKRLWGETGQKALSTANICVLGATAAACEALKNIVLAGIGNFIIVDDGLITAVDAGSNFFTPYSELGKGRAEVCANTIGELNPYVKGRFVKQSPEEFIATAFDATEPPITVVISGGLPQSTLVPLSKKLAAKDIPLIHLKCVGMLGYIRIQLGQRTIIETFPDWPKVDLRLDRQFPALTEILNGFENPYEIEERETFNTVPWPILVNHAIKLWREENKKDASVFPTFAERRAIKAAILKHANDKSTNYFEAGDNIMNNSVTPQLTGDLQELFKHPSIEVPQTEFWALLRAVRDFYQENGVLPHSGKFPDMHSNPKMYLELKKVYTEKGKQDAQNIQARAQKYVSDREITERLAKTMCENAMYVRVLEGKTIAAEYEASPLGAKTGNNMEAWYALFRVAEYFAQEVKRYPGDIDGDSEPDIAILDKLVKQHVKPEEVGAVTAAHVREFCRFGNTEFSTVATVMGGIATQELQKVLTNQRVPVNNSMIFDGIANNTATFFA